MDNLKLAQMESDLEFIEIRIREFSEEAGNLRNEIEKIMSKERLRKEQT